MKIFLILIFGISSVAWSSTEKPFTGSPEAYYNEALAEKESGDLPAASLALRRALVLDPTLVVAQQQLKEVLSKLGLPIESSWQQALASRYSPEKISFVGMILGWSATFLLVVLFFVYILSSARKPKRWGLFLVVLFFCLVGHALSVLGVIIDPRLRARYEVILLPKTDARAALEHRPDRPAILPLRATPTDSAEVIAQLPTGSCLILLSQHGAWSYVRTAAGQEGWIASSSLESIIPKK
ncbi:MAG: SH3 domain-containing protein [Verrucomicrobia bacterium]|nr:SH3 domain-containing protein [Verrucomicrobiota bacterium]